MKISILTLPTGPLDANCYLLVNPAAGECVIADPGGDAEKIARLAAPYSPRAVVLTHAHFDHIGAVDELCTRYQVPLYLHEADVPLLTDPEKNVSALFGTPFRVTVSPRIVRDGETLTLAGIPLQVLHTPGHTPGGCCYLLPDGQGVLTGDTLFAAGYGRTDFPGGSFEELKRSLGKLFRLSPRRISYPGHGEPGFAGCDRKEN